MAQPRLTFFCELDADALQALFADPTVTDSLIALGAGISLGILDLSAERAAVVRHLNETGIPVIAWQLLPEEQGYWFNVGNAPQAAARYAEFKRWTARHSLHWAGVGLDIEPDIREMQQLAVGKWPLLPTLLKRALNQERLRRAQTQYSALVAQIRADGYRVDSYQMPFIVDERKAGSTLLQRIGGIVDITVDREVLMLYTSFFRPRGPGLLWSYAAEAGSVGLGSTGGGVELEGVADTRPLDWAEFSRDLLLARRCTDDIHVFSLEGCVRQGFLPLLQAFDWGQPVTPPLAIAAHVEGFRRALRAALWTTAHPCLLLAGLLGMLGLVRRLRRRR